MTEAEKGGPSVGAKAGEDVDRARHRLEEEKRAAEDLAHEAREAASGIGERARRAVARQGEEVRDEAASHLRNFADAVRSAGDELAEKEPGMISDVVREAARGLERFSESLSHKNPADMFGAVGDFGRRHPAAFVAGCVLAGFAVARFATAAGPQRHDHGGRGFDRGYEGDRYGGAYDRGDSWTRESERTQASGPARGTAGGYPGAGAGAGVGGTGLGSGPASGTVSGSATGIGSGTAAGTSGSSGTGSASAGVAGTGATHPNAPGVGGASYGSSGEGSGGPGFGGGAGTSGSDSKTGDKR
jgi:hypothetical protein